MKKCETKDSINIKNHFSDEEIIIDKIGISKYRKNGELICEDFWTNKFIVIYFNKYNHRSRGRSYICIYFSENNKYEFHWRHSQIKELSKIIDISDIKKEKRKDDIIWLIIYLIFIVLVSVLTYCDIRK